MHLGEYQTEAIKTRQVASCQVPDPVIPLLGLAGETGELLSEYKKSLRDGGSYKLAKERIAEELGDLLWYLSNVADLFGLSLEDIGQNNLDKCRQRWGDHRSEAATRFDEGFPIAERFPRTCVVRLESQEDGNKTQLIMYVDGAQVGDALTDNAYEADGYRFHDVFHLACAACLGWSPVLRKLWNCKRKSVPNVDEVEDGARAAITEECIAALVFRYAEAHNHLAGVTTLDYDLLRTIKGMTCGFEVEACTIGDWERAIFNCYEIWRYLEAHNGVTIVLDLDDRVLSIQD